MAMKASKVTEYPRTDIDKEACAWIAQFDGSDPSPEDLEAFKEWVNRSPRHQEAIERLSSLWGELNVLTELATTLPARQESRPPRSMPWLAIAASAVLAISILLLRMPLSDDEQSEVLYATAIGEQRLVYLADNSAVQLNTASQIRVAYGDSARKVFLLEGEAFFDVQSDPDRPFVVYVGGKAVRAVGTSFSVHLRDEDVEVLVTEGLVELSEVAVEPGQRIEEASKPIGRIKGGQRIRIGQSLESAEPVSEEEMSRELAWREGMLSFSGEPLAYVADEIGRYTSMTIVIEDPALQELRIGGYFKTGDVEAMFMVLEAGFNIEVERIGEDVARLSARE